MVTARSQPARDLRQLTRAPEKLFRHVCQPLGQGDALLVRHLAALAPLDVLQEGALDRPRIGLRQGAAFLAPAPLFFGVREAHAGTLARLRYRRPVRSIMPSVTARRALISLRNFACFAA